MTMMTMDKERHGAVPHPARGRRTVLFVCTGNSARSVIAEALLNHHGKGRYHALSAGSHPAGAVNPYTLAVLRDRDIPTADLRSKSWEEFEGVRAPKIDIVVTVCDSAAREACPVWPGAPVRCHWGVPDPAAARGSEIAVRAAFDQAYERMERRIRRFLDLPVDELEPRDLRVALDAIGVSADPA